MGTSTVHRSPRGLLWGIVNDLYQDPTTDSERILVQVFRAGEQYAVGLADDAVLDRLSALLTWTQSESWRQDLDGALQTARNATIDAQQASLQGGRTSFYA